MIHLKFVVAIVLLTTQSILSFKFEEIAAGCNKESGFTGDIQKIDFNDPDISKEAKCAGACVLDKKGVLKADGTIDIDKEKAIQKELIEDEELRKVYSKAVEDCKVSAKADKCETAYEYLKCLTPKLKKIE